MALCIKTKNGQAWYTNDDIPTVLDAINAGQPIRVWWFAAWGQRFSETLYIPSEELAYLCTESDDG